MLSPAVTPRAQRRAKQPRTPRSENQEKENVCRRTPTNRPISLPLRSTPLSPHVTNHPASPLPNLKQRRLQDLQKCLDDASGNGRAAEDVLEEISQRRRIDTPPTAKGHSRTQDLKSPHGTGRKTKKSKKRRFEDIATVLSVSEETDTNDAKRLHSSPKPPAVLPNPTSTANRARPNPFDQPLLGTTSKNDKARPNPFDFPLQPVKTTAAPVKSYARSEQTRHLARSTDVVNNDAPVRELVSYADLWEGVSCIAPEELSLPPLEDTYGANAPMYDFLYDGIWKRRCGNTIVSVGKRRRVFWRGECWYGGWCRIGKCANVNSAYKDLDCPHVDSLLVCGD